MSNPDEGIRDVRNERLGACARGSAVQSGVMLPGVEGVSDYELIHDPDEDELTLWIGDLLVARVEHSAKAQLEYLGSDPAGPDSVRGVHFPSSADPRCGFTVLVDDGELLLVDDELNTLAALTEAPKILEFLRDATTGGGLV